MRVVDRNYCRRCRSYSLLPNHCDNCGDVLSVAPIPWRAWFEAGKWVLLLVGFFCGGVVFGFALAVLREFNR
jgi:hypothetical protein